MGKELTWLKRFELDTGREKWLVSPALRFLDRFSCRPIPRAGHEWRPDEALEDLPLPASIPLSIPHTSPVGFTRAKGVTLPR